MIDNKNIIRCVEMFRENRDLGISWFNLIEATDRVEWEFSSDLSNEDRNFIKQCYNTGDPADENVPGIGGSEWLFNGSHDWQVQDITNVSHDRD